MSRDRLFVSAVVVPMTTPPIRNAGVLVRDGVILAVGRANDLARSRRHVDEIDLGKSILLPGLVNPHVHLELSHCQAEPSRGLLFTDWILALGRQLERDKPDFADRIARATVAGAMESLRSGVTCVGDISQHVSITRPVLRDGPLRVVSLGEALGLARLRPRFEQQRVRALDLSDESTFLRCGLSPHAPYTVDEPGLRECVHDAVEARRPIAIHLAETADEADFTSRLDGTFRLLWERIGSWQDDVPCPGVSPIELAERTGLLRAGALLAHVNHVDDAELDLLARRPSSVVYCPRTHAYFGHPPHRWREMLSRGINVALGTDSRASNPDLDLMQELRLVCRLAPDLSATELLKLVTTNAARAIGESSRVGALSAGLHADFSVFPHAGHEPLETLLRDPLPCLETWIAARRVFTA
jgi:cytosine/adenosine deaminase-related metal-dependent hydrolase